MVFLSTSRQIPGEDLKLDEDRFLSDTFNSLFTMFDSVQYEEQTHYRQTSCRLTSGYDVSEGRTLSIFRVF
jgi:hypothetical protein